MSATQPTPGGKRDQPEAPAVNAELDDLAASTAPMPTTHTLRMHTNVPFQVVRFGIVNLKMLRMEVKPHN